MSSLAQTYANHCGASLPENPPDYPSVFFPIPEKYITLHTTSKQSSKDYDYFSEVVNLLMPALKRNGIHVVQIGTEKEKKIPFCIDYLGKTSVRQATFVVENALLHFGIDSFWQHVAGLKKVPFVEVNSVNATNAILPHYKTKFFVVESHRNGNKPSYSAVENPKTINLIKPEEVAVAVLNLLGVNEQINVETLYIGERFYGQDIDYVPDHVIPMIEEFHYKKINCRLDLNYNIQFLQDLLSKYKAAIITHQSIQEEILVHFKPNIPVILYRIKNGKYDLNFIQTMTKLGINFQMSSNFSDKELADLRLELFDYGKIVEESKFTEGFKFFSKEENLTKNSIFRTNRHILSKNKMYPSVYHWKNNKDFRGEPLRIGEALNEPSFVENGQHYYIFNLKK